MAPAASRTIVVAGAGIAGLTAGLALAQRGFRAFILEQAERIEEIGAGIQLSPNATRVLIDLGLESAMRKVAIAPEAIRVRKARSGEDIVRLPLGSAFEQRYGAPYWAVHRGDLQAVLLAEARNQPDIELELGVKVQTFASHANGVTVKAMRRLADVDAHGLALIGADGLWSTVRTALGDTTPPRFAGRVAWRATIPADQAPEEARAPVVNLWLGHKAHLVHYPVQGGRAVNIVAIAADTWNAAGWSAEATPAEVMTRFAPGKWSGHARDLLSVPERWQKWALHERASINPSRQELVTLIGDAAHPVLPFLAQGAALAIEDAAVLAARLAQAPDRLASGMRRYEAEQRARWARVQRAARRNGTLYQYYGPDAAVRNLVMRMIGGGRILSRYDWIYGWRGEPVRATDVGP